MEVQLQASRSLDFKWVSIKSFACPDNRDTAGPATLNPNLVRVEGLGFRVGTFGALGKNQRAPNEDSVEGKCSLMAGDFSPLMAIKYQHTQN